MTKYALITGASSGIGLALARYAAEQGYNIGLCARRKDRLSALAQELTDQFNISVDVFALDLSKPDSAQTLLAALQDKGRHVDSLVNNAGLSIPQSFAGTEAQRQRAFLDLTITTPTLLAHSLIQPMIERGFGRIINISSIMALSSGGKGHTLYPAGKAYLLKFSQSLNAEMRGKGVHVCAVLPGIVKTDFQTANGMPEDESLSGSRFAQTAEQVAHAAWRGAERGHEIIIPGLSAKLAAAVLRYTPERLLRAVTRPIAEKHFIGD